MSDLTDWLISIGTVGGALASAGAAWAAVRGLNEAKQTRLATTRPFITFRKVRTPDGGYYGQTHALNCEYARTSGNYYFATCNQGNGIAILGNNPFRSVNPKDLLADIYANNPLPERMVHAVPDVRGVIPPNVEFNVQLVLGYFEHKLMENPFIFQIYYTSVSGEEMWTSVAIDPTTGDVIDMEFGGGDSVRDGMWERFAAWWKRNAGDW